MLHTAFFPLFRVQVTVVLPVDIPLTSPLARVAVAIFELLDE